MSGGIFAAIGILKKTFDKYAGSDGDKGTLSKKELTVMLKNEIPELGGKEAETEAFFKALDNDADGVVDFKEYIIFVSTLALLLFES